MQSIFIVDDDTVQSGMLKDFLTNSERSIRTINSGEECLALLRTDNSEPDIIFLDYNFDKAGPKAMNGVDILQQIKALKPAVEVVMLSSQDKIEVALNTMKYGAYDYVIKGETAFYRAENAIENIAERLNLKSQVGLYKRIAWSMGGAVIVTLIIIFVFYKLSKTGML